MQSQQDGQLGGQQQQQGVQGQREVESGHGAGIPHSTVSHCVGGTKATPSPFTEIKQEIKDEHVEAADFINAVKEEKMDTEVTPMTSVQGEAEQQQRQRAEDAEQQGRLPKLHEQQPQPQGQEGQEKDEKPGSQGGQQKLEQLLKQEHRKETQQLQPFHQPQQQSQFQRSQKQQYNQQQQQPKPQSQQQCFQDQQKQQPKQQPPSEQQQLDSQQQQEKQQSRSQQQLQPHQTQQQQLQLQQQQQLILNRESKLISTCRMGQEMVHEIVLRTQEVFSYLKTIHPVVGAPLQDQQCVEKQQRMMDVLKAISLLMTKLRACKDLVKDPDQGKHDILQCIPFKDDDDEVKQRREKAFQSEAYKQALAEHNDLVLQLNVRNKHLKDIIDQMRNIIWEINTMLDMRERQV